MTRRNVARARKGACSRWVGTSAARVGGFAALFGCAAGAGGCALRFSDLARPVYTIGSEDGNCGWTVAVDGRGRVYSEGGCENGAVSYSRAATASEAELGAILAAFANLPDPEAWRANPALLPNAAPRVDELRFFACTAELSFAVFDAAQPSRSWRVDAKDECEMPAPFHAVREAIGRVRWDVR